MSGYVLVPVSLKSKHSHWGRVEEIEALALRLEPAMKSNKDHVREALQRRPVRERFRRSCRAERRSSCEHQMFLHDRFADSEHLSSVATVIQSLEVGVLLFCAMVFSMPGESIQTSSSTHVLEHHQHTPHREDHEPD